MLDSIYQKEIDRIKLLAQDGDYGDFEHPVIGSGSIVSGIMLIGEAPGADEHVAADAHGSRLPVADVQPSVLAVLPAGGVEVSVEYFGSSPDVHVVADGDAVVAVDAGVADA